MATSVLPVTLTRRERELHAWLGSDTITMCDVINLARGELSYYFSSAVHGGWHRRAVIMALLRAEVCCVNERPIYRPYLTDELKFMLSYSLGLPYVWGANIDKPRFLAESLREVSQRCEIRPVWRQSDGALVSSFSDAIKLDVRHVWTVIPAYQQDDDGRLVVRQLYIECCRSKHSVLARTAYGNLLASDTSIGLCQLPPCSNVLAELRPENECCTQPACIDLHFFESVEFNSRNGLPVVAI
ncbi:hypothetical protein FJZ39_02645 [Candidatus Saccharibacteria bacterium]|nr:hypothetical protein [Candidatus Saccharibacteria bacterium]